MRHGPAEDHAASGRDFDRALTPSGRERVRDVARALVEGGEVPHLIITSPLVRAFQTAALVAGLAQLAGGDALEAPRVEIQRELSPEGDSAAFALKLLEGSRDRVMIVGHEPILGELSARLTGRDGDFRAGLQKAMVVGLDSRKDDPAGLPMRLRFVLEPKSLDWLHDARPAQRP
jgi:phosphohistidine phosphatase